MKYLTKKELRKVAELLQMHITQNRNGWVQIWMSKPIRDDKEGVWKGDEPSISKMAIIAPYTRNWKKSLITPKTNSYMEGV